MGQHSCAIRLAVLAAAAGDEGRWNTMSLVGWCGIWQAHVALGGAEETVSNGSLLVGASGEPSTIRWVAMADDEDRAWEGVPCPTEGTGGVVNVLSGGAAGTAKAGHLG